MPDPTAELYSADGKRTGEVDLNPDIFGIEPNMDVMHQVVTAQQAAARAGTHSTKTRAEVRGGGRKPWRQKGLGRARHGSIRSPQWAGGGVAHGPKPRDYSQRTPKKMKRLALRSALSARAADDRIKVVDVAGCDFKRIRRVVAGECDAIPVDDDTTLRHDRHDIHAVFLSQQLIVIVLKNLQIEKPR